MEPITIASLVTAAVAGLTSGVQESGKNLVVDSFKALKTRLSEKLGPENKVSKAITEIENEPDFEPHQATLAKRIEDAEITEDQDIVELIGKLQAALEQSGTDQFSKQTQINISDNAKVAVVGDNAKVEGGVHFGTTKP